MQVGSQLDLQRISIKGFVPESTGTGPSSPVEGQGWHDSSAQVWRAWLNGAWRGIVDYRRTVATGTGLLGGGALSGDLTLSVNFAANGESAAGKAVQSNDTRLGQASGTAGGDLTGSYPNPTIAPLAVTDAKVAAANKDGAAGVPSMRTLGNGALQARSGASTVSDLPAPTTPLSMNGQRITSIAEPTQASDAATKNYVDALIQGLAPKESVRLATTNVSPGNYTISGMSITNAPSQVDSVNVAVGDRILLKDAQNTVSIGIYVVNTVGTGANGTWTRTTDADSEGDLLSAFTFVEEGTVNANTGWVQISDRPITIGTTPLQFIQFSGAGGINAGAGLTQSGNTIDVGGSASIQVNADNIQLHPTYLIPVTNGGTGANNSNNARNNLGIPRVYTGTIGALTAGTWTTISSGNMALLVSLRFFVTATGEETMIDSRHVGAGNPVQVRADIAYAANALSFIMLAFVDSTGTGNI